MLYKELFKALSKKKRMEKMNVISQSVQLTLRGWIKINPTNFFEQLDKQDITLCIRDMRQNLVWIGRAHKFDVRGKRVLLSILYYTNAKVTSTRRIKGVRCVELTQKQVYASSTYCEIIKKNEVKKTMKKYQLIMGL